MKNIEDNKILRSVDELKFIFDNKGSSYIDLKYNMYWLTEAPIHKIKDNKIGVIDLETFTYLDDGSQKVYAGGFAVEDLVKTYYLGDEGCTTTNELINSMFNDIFNLGFENYTFYAHNFSSFDSILLLIL